ncbi:MAG: hypothetical protein KDA84_05525, partial [Planctomycetaceae bacterium]|nr:hypothetical protein [Planctomycetaceae bacterium]
WPCSDCGDLVTKSLASLPDSNTLGKTHAQEPSPERLSSRFMRIGGCIWFCAGKSEIPSFFVSSRWIGSHYMHTESTQNAVTWIAQSRIRAMPHRFEGLPQKEAKRLARDDLGDAGKLAIHFDSQNANEGRNSCVTHWRPEF